MSDKEFQQQTTINVQEKANLIWAIADKLVGVFKPHEYGNVILPMCIIKRFDDALAPTKEAVLAEKDKHNDKAEPLRAIFYQQAAKQQFYNLSPFTFKTLLDDASNIKDNFTSYINQFSKNVIDIIELMEFENVIKKLADNNLLFLVISEFCTPKAYLGADKVSSVDMGYIFEELVRKFSESYDEHAGAHFTARDIIELMAETLVGDDEERLKQNGIAAHIYDMAMGTSQMLTCLTDRLLQIDPAAEVISYGQEINEQTFAIAKADTLIRGGRADNMKLGDTLGNDKFSAYKFDYVISNPPFGIEWKTSEKKVKQEHENGKAGRFEPGLPSINDGQMLFMLNGLAKLKLYGRMAIIQNGSPLFNGDAGSGESNIRGYLLENDWLEAIIKLPNDLFYNTGIATYVWVVTRAKSEQRWGQVQLIDASDCYEKRRKSLGNKRVEITPLCRELIMRAYRNFSNWEYRDEEHGIRVESKVFNNDYFKYSKLTILRPLRLRYEKLTLPTDSVVAKVTDRQYLQQVVDAYHKHFGNQPIDDDTLCAMLKQEKIKITQERAKLIRKVLGTKDPQYSEVHKKPNDKTGGYEWDNGLTDTEIIPWQEDTNKYLEKNVRPYAPDFVVDKSKTKIGYEIPFTREFYKYVPPRSSEEIYANLKGLEQQEAELMNKLFG